MPDTLPGWIFISACWIALMATAFCVVVAIVYEAFFKGGRNA